MPDSDLEGQMHPWFLLTCYWQSPGDTCTGEYESRLLGYLVEVVWGKGSPALVAMPFRACRSHSTTGNERMDQTSFWHHLRMTVGTEV